MYKLMLVEDEPAVLNAMVSTLDWNALSFHTPVACAHGQAAIDAIESGFMPDAVITDICMPFVDGVALTEYLALHCPQALVVMLSGYNDFAYAHKAIKLKVYDYVLKPITPKGLRQLATRLCDELEDRRIRGADDFDALTRERFFANLLTAHLDEKTIADNLRVHKIEVDGPWWTVMAVDLGLSAANTVAQSRDNELARYGLCNIVAELTEALPRVVACPTVKEYCCVLLNGESSEALRESALALSGQIADACKMIRREPTCGVGKPVNSPAALPNAYLQAVLALQYRFFFGALPCILSEEIEVPPAEAFDYGVYEEQLNATLKQANREGTLDAVDALFERMRTQKLPYTHCLRYCQRTVLLLLERMGEYLSPEEVETLESSWDNAGLSGSATLPQLHEMVRALCVLSFDRFALVCEDDATLRVRRAEAYIREHYRDDTLSLNTIRDKFSISVSYFSAIFKAGTGYTFVEYLTQVRIDKAKELLRLTDKRTSEVAGEVGFADPHYFSITFKRVTGNTPREYRLEHRAAN
ncbi:MAG: helix-turn-helix domain-containing protein [Gemmiger sp.]|nr:helix-turn-helix domain-containing protein [Gemmiger sp.]